MNICLAFALLCALVPGTISAQTSSSLSDTLVAGQHASLARGQYATFKRVMIASAEKMPEESYAFRPVPEVRSYAELLNHVTFGNFLFCAELRGEPNPKQGVAFDRTFVTKADIVQVMKDSFAFCDGAFSTLSAATLMTTIKIPGRNNTTSEIPRLNRTWYLLTHGNEHYGNVVTYLRLKGLVPPSSEPAPPRSGP